MERAQQKVEARNFDIRKTLIKFDNVLNDQRHVIFSQRDNAMNSDEIFSFSEGFLNEIIDDLIKLKLQRMSDPKNNEFNLKMIINCQIHNAIQKAQIIETKNHIFKP